MLTRATRIIEAHELIGFRTETPNFSIPNREGEQDSDLSPRAVSLQQMWHRGRFEPSLLADSSARSRLWRAEALQAEILPIAGYFGIKGEFLAFWQAIAQRNGCDERGIQQKSGLNKNLFDQLVAHCAARDLFFRLDEWLPPDDAADPRHLLYWSDSGMLHQLLGFNEEILLDWVAKQTKSERERREFRRGKSWEGFGISTLLRATKSRAQGKFWQASNGEIDLILEWNETNLKWAIEMTSGRRKKVNGGFDSGCRVTDAERAMIVFPEEQKAPAIKGAAKVPIDIERMTLEAALKAVLNGP